MIQKFICVPKSDYDVIVISNGTIQQIEAGLEKLNESTNNEIPVNGHITYLDTFDQLLHHLGSNTSKAAPGTESRAFNGKVLFMFFNGLDYVQNMLSSLIDHYNKCLFIDTIHFQYNQYASNHKSRDLNPIYETIENAYFYFDSSTIMDVAYEDPLDLYASLAEPATFTTIVSIANDILKKMSFMLGRIRGLYIDDIHLVGEKAYPLKSLVRNFPNVERIELASRPSRLMANIAV